jgi:ribosomal-protein-alanine N-acetyltransferase
MTELTTTRTHLRMFTVDDLDALARITANSDVMKHLGITGEPISRTETETALHSIIKHWSRHSFGRWAVVHKDDGQLIGFAGLRWFEQVLNEGGKPELVYLLDKPYWGQGLATEIARAILKYGFEELDFDEIVALVKQGNTVSRHILEKKLWMRPIGEIVYFGIPVLKFALTRAEYLNGKLS